MVQTCATFPFINHYLNISFVQISRAFTIKTIPVRSVHFGLSRPLQALSCCMLSKALSPSISLFASSSPSVKTNAVPPRPPSMNAPQCLVKRATTQGLGTSLCRQTQLLPRQGKVANFTPPHTAGPSMRPLQAVNTPAAPYQSQHTPPAQTSQPSADTLSSTLFLDLNASLKEGNAAPLQCSKHGSIDLIVGPMFAGKTNELLKRIREVQQQGSSVLVLKSTKDIRYEAAHINSHSGQKLPCLEAQSLLHAKQLWATEYEQADVIGIDESQFFEDLFEFVEAAVDGDGKHIIAAGLDGDFQRSKFGHMLDLVPMADNVVKLKGKCGCGRPSLFSLRVAASKEQELVGGSDAYKPVCRSCYIQAERQKTERQNGSDKLVAK